MSIAVVVLPGFVCKPPSSAARRAPWRTAEPDVALSVARMLASKPPRSIKASSGVRIASSTADCPSWQRESGWRQNRKRLRISVALRLQPNDLRGAGPQRPERPQKASLPFIGESDRHAEEVTGPISDVTRGRWPGLGHHRAAINRVPVEEDGIGDVVPTPVQVDLVNINLVHREDARRSDAVANRADRLVIGGNRIAELGCQLRTLDRGVTNGSHAEHDHAAVQQPQDEHEEDWHDNGELGHCLAAAVYPSLPPPYEKHYAPYTLERSDWVRPMGSGQVATGVLGPRFPLRSRDHCHVAVGRGDAARHPVSVGPLSRQMAGGNPVAIGVTRAKGVEVRGTYPATK